MGDYDGLFDQTASFDASPVDQEAAGRGVQARADGCHQHSQQIQLQQGKQLSYFIPPPFPIVMQKEQMV